MHAGIIYPTSYFTVDSYWAHMMLKSKAFWLKIFKQHIHMIDILKKLVNLSNEKLTT